MGAAFPLLSPEQLAKIREIHARVLNAPAEERAGLAELLCDGDSLIESEIRSLLSAHDHAGNFLDVPAAVALNCVPSEDLLERDLASGAILASRFHILHLINSGGMGAVYEAWDSELQDVVALKTIRPEIASNSSIIELFKREVRQARQITHPNICRVYDLFNHELNSGERLWFLTMQLIKGTTLLEHIRSKGPFSIRAALPLVKQMVSGLAAAHEYGIVHRDFKSANVMLMEGAGNTLCAVITDFGLACPANARGEPQGSFVRQGTPAYAAPEQWFDGVVAPAGDQYSLGVVLCEMLTGERPEPAIGRQGSASAVKLPAGLRKEARWEASICRCLQPKPEDRFATLHHLLRVVDPSYRRRIVLRWTGVALAISVVAVTCILAWKSMNQLPSLTGLRLLTPAMDFSEGPNLSADGRTIAYVSDRAEEGNLDIWVQPLPGGTPRRITTNPAIDEEPSISPDGHLVVFHSTRNPQGVYLADIQNGGERLLIPDARQAQFSPDGGSILYITGDEYDVQPSGKIFLYNLQSGTSYQLARDIVDARYPVWNSDGLHILFSGCASLAQSFPDCKDFWITDRTGATPHRTNVIPQLLSEGVKPHDYFGGWRRDTLVFSGMHNGELGLWALKLDPDLATLSGHAKQLMAGDARDFIMASSLVGDSLAICEWNPAKHVFRIDPIWQADHTVDVELTKAVRITSDPMFDNGPSVSHNGRWLVFVRGSDSERTIFIAQAQTGFETPVRFPASPKFFPIIDNAGQTFVFESADRNGIGIWVGNRAGVVRKLCAECRSPYGWLNDEKSVLYSDGALSEVRMQSIQGGSPRTILKDPLGGDVQDATWSQESRSILFSVSRPKSEGQVYATRFLPGADSPEPNWVAITPRAEPVRKPRWSGDGRTIFYFSSRDGFWCLWGRHFDPEAGQPIGEPFIVHHFHNSKNSPASLHPLSFNMSVAGDSIYLNVLETSGAIYLGKLKNSFLSAGRP